jgi:hypothetical protein
MDDLLGELAADLAEDTLYDDFDNSMDTQFRSRAYTWPSQPLSYESPVVCNAEPLSTLKVGDLATANSGSTNLSSANDISPSAEPPGSPDTTGSARKVFQLTWGMIIVVLTIENQIYCSYNHTSSALWHFVQIVFNVSY